LNSFAVLEWIGATPDLGSKYRSGKTEFCDGSG
jgi:hypothetical protein